MTQPDTIPVQRAATWEGSTQNVLPLLHEIRHALARLLESGTGTTIDLRSLPFTDHDYTELETRLGSGEVSIHIDALGPSEIRETIYPGVWLVTHYNNSDDILARFVEVARIPEVAAAQAEDMRSGLQRLYDQLACGGTAGT